MNDAVLLVDIGATKTRLALGREEKGNPVIWSLETSETPGTWEGVLELITTYASIHKGFSKISISSIGPLDLGKGVVLDTPNRRMGSYPLRDSLEERLGREVILYNDCQAAVWGEHVYGRFKGVANMVYITLSTGIGAGVIVDGHLLLGAHGNAHEAGHIVIDYDSILECGCGGRGHWEAYGGGGNTARMTRWFALRYKGAKTECYDKALGEGLSPEELFSCINRGDEFASSVAGFLHRVHAAGVASVIAAYDPEVILFGGALFYSWPGDFLGETRRLVRGYLLNTGYTPLLAASSYPGIEPLIGALATVLHAPR